MTDRLYQLTTGRSHWFSISGDRRPTTPLALELVSQVFSTVLPPMILLPQVLLNTSLRIEDVLLRSEYMTSLSIAVTLV